MKQRSLVRILIPPLEDVQSIHTSMFLKILNNDSESQTTILANIYIACFKIINLNRPLQHCLSINMEKEANFVDKMSQTYWNCA
jgi:hypothetical protein